MTSLRTDIALQELVQLLTRTELAGPALHRLIERAQLALDDPELFVTRYPDADWLIDGLDPNADSGASTRLLTNVLLEDLRDWLLTGRHPLMVAERIIDRLAMDGIRIADPPSYLRTLQQHCGHLVEKLALLSPPRKLLRLEVDSQSAGFVVLLAPDASRAQVLAKALSLPLKEWKE